MTERQKIELVNLNAILLANDGHVLEGVNIIKNEVLPFYKMKEEKYVDLLAITYSNLYVNLCEIGEYEKALKYTELYEDLAKKYNRDDLLIDAYTIQIDSLILIGRKNKAISCVNYCIENTDIMQKTFPSRLVVLYNQVGYYYKMIGDTKKSCEYFTKSLELKKEVYSNGNSHILIGEINLLNIKSKMNKSKKLLIDFDFICNEYQDSINSNLVLKSHILLNRCIICYNIKDYDEGIISIDEGIKVIKNLAEEFIIDNAYFIFYRNRFLYLKENYNEVLSNSVNDLPFFEKYCHNDVEFILEFYYLVSLSKKRLGVPFETDLNYCENYATNHDVIEYYNNLKDNEDYKYE